MISKKTKYAIKALVNLATHYPNWQKTASIAHESQIPKKFLELILLDLKQKNWVESRMGQNGGYALKTAPQQISLADVYRLFEGAVALVPCASEHFYSPCQDCPDVNTCLLRPTFVHLRAHMLSSMEHTTIADVLQRPNLPIE